MEEKRLYEFLDEMGLSKRKADIYIYLSKKGVQKAQSIASYLGIDRAQTYRLLRSLKQKGIVEETIESPTRYLAIPIENLIESFLEDKKIEINNLEAEKTKFIDYFKSISKRETENPMAKFQIIPGRNGIYSKILQMAEQSEKEVSKVTTNLGLIQEDTFGLFDKIIEIAKEKRDIKFKMLVNISQENLKIMKNILNRISNNMYNIQWRHAIVVSGYYPRFLIKDNEEILLYVSSKDTKGVSNKEDNGLWVASKMFVSTLRASFNEIWSNAINAIDKIKELETGAPIEKTVIFKESTEAQRKMTEILNTAKNEIILILSSNGIIRLLNDNLFKLCSNKDVKIRIMAPIDLDNLDAAKELSKLYKIKHVSISYLTMMIVDKKSLFIFNAPPLDKKINAAPFYLKNSFFTNDKKYLERTNQLLEDIWKRGTYLSEIGSSSSLGKTVFSVLDTDPINEIINVMMKNNVRSVLVTENSKTIGIIDQKDILTKIIKSNKDPAKTCAKEIMSIPILMINSDEPLINALKTILN
ncbi:MAG: helix-turn-helix domain-containing protein [Candidatus Bathyarchaeota archaeon]